MAVARLSDEDPDGVARAHAGAGADLASLTAPRIAGVGARGSERGPASHSVRTGTTASTSTVALGEMPNAQPRQTWA
jgi:hypothetical protein